MKKLILVALAAILATGCDGISDPSSYPLQDVDAAYEIDGWGTNPDIYEWTPKGNPGYVCVYVVSGSDGPVGVQCFPKG